MAITDPVADMLTRIRNGAKAKFSSVDVPGSKLKVEALIATVAETEQGIIGYQMTTGHGPRAHLARLAVDPGMQGRGIGRALLSDLFAYLTRTGTTRLSVNTQSDNRVCLKLYKSMGFIRTGEEYPVYTFEVPAG